VGLASLAGCMSCFAIAIRVESFFVLVRSGIQILNMSGFL
jgi:hypothetical protein